MELSNFALSRDLLYLASVAFGIAIGFFLCLLKKSIDSKKRSRNITAALLFLSLTLACLALSFIFSMGDIFKYTPVLITCAVFFCLSVLAVPFPKSVAFPLILLCGLIVAALGIYCLRFPELKNDAALLIKYTESVSSADNNNPDSSNLIKLASQTKKIADDDEFINAVKINGKYSSLDISMCIIEIDPRYPLFGGSRHGFIRSINSGAALYNDKSLGSPAAKFLFRYFSSGFLRKFLGIGFLELQFETDLTDITPGKILLINIDHI